MATICIFQVNYSYSFYILIVVIYCVLRNITNYYFVKIVTFSCLKNHHTFSWGILATVSFKLIFFWRRVEFNLHVFPHGCSVGLLHLLARCPPVLFSSALVEIQFYYLKLGLVLYCFADSIDVINYY